MKKGFFISLLVLISFFSFQHLSQAQKPSVGADTDLLLTVSMLPEIPKANSSVDISVESYADFDINSSLITWSLNGKIQKEGVGEKKFSFTTGPLGTISKIIITVAPPKTLSFSRTIEIQPSDVDLLWEAQSYTPLFYLGRSLYSTESKITLEAIPHFIKSDKTQIPRENLIYRWTVGDYFYADASGYGKSFFSYNGSLLEKREKVEVVVLSADGKMSAINTLTIQPTDPKVLVYENNPLYGFLYNKEVGYKYPLKEKEVSFVASPYFFSTENQGLNLDFAWLMNGQPVTYSNLKNEIVLRQDGKTSGLTNISVAVKNASKLLQSGSKDFSVSFENN